MIWKFDGLSVACNSASSNVVVLFLPYKNKTEKGLSVVMDTLIPTRENETG